MTTYRLDHHERGVISLESGTWRWFVIRLNSLPEVVCESQQLYFANESQPGDVMRARIPCDVNEIDDGAVAEYARNPDEREFRTSAGRFSIRPPSDIGNSRMWNVRPERGRLHRTSFAIDTPLGELTHDELLAILPR